MYSVLSEPNETIQSMNFLQMIIGRILLEKTKKA